ncbi:MAG: hypothetical protein EON52_05540 [Actinomycetales bacterium]|nr:MAG: hypothetical protein EON52_05540 [Actinomycetales bacterium]
MTDPIEVRLLGGPLVTRQDGTAVAHTEWNAGKTTDLLRLLALDAGQLVRSETLVDTLWPDVPAESGRASLRTATSRIRKTIGSHCVRSHLGTLTLVDAWVDTVQLTTLVTTGRRAARAGDDVAVVQAARRAEALYTRDFHAYSDDQPWATQTRSTLAFQRHQLVAAAAESAVRLFWLRDAVELARLGVALDPASERAHRTLMSAYAGLGRTDDALRQFELCRAALAEELGADPSQQTRALHLSILAGAPPVAPHHRFVGRTREVVDLVESIDDVHAVDGSGVVCVVGAPGSGRHALVDAGLQQARRSTASIDVWGPFDHDGAEVAVTMRERLAEREAVLPGTIIALTAPDVLPTVVSVAEQAGRGVRVVGSPPLTEDDLLHLTEQVLGGAPSDLLVETLARETGHLAGRAVEELHRWMAQGRITATGTAVDLWGSAPPEEPPMASGLHLGLLLEQLGPAEVRLCELMAVADRAVSIDAVLAVLPADRRVAAARRSMASVMDRLLDRGVVQEDRRPGHYRFADPRVGGAFAARLRPAVRARLRRLWDGTETPADSWTAPDRRSVARDVGDRRRAEGGRRASDRH